MSLHGIQELRESFAGVVGAEIGKRVFKLGRVEALRVDGYLCESASGMSEPARWSRHERGSCVPMRLTLWRLRRPRVPLQYSRAVRRREQDSSKIRARTSTPATP
jgi:hypothetical protein